MDQKLIAAQAMAQAVQYDPQFILPRYPRFPKELVTIALDDALLIDGTDSLQVLRGRATKAFLPRLLSLLDGTRTIEQLAEAFPGMTKAAISNAVSLLYTRGVLEDAEVNASFVPDPLHTETTAFFRRYIDTTRVNRSALQAQQRLQDTTVTIYTSGPHAAEMQSCLASQLQMSGVGNLYLPDYQPSSFAEIAQPQTTKRLVVVFVEGEHDQQWLEALDDYCAASGIYWLLATVSPDAQHFELGPYIEHGETTCYRCFAQATKGRRSGKTGSLPSTSSRQRVQVALDFLALEIIYLLSRIITPATGASVMRYDLTDWTTQRERYPKLPGCRYCRPLPANIQKMVQPTGWVDTALVYEDAVAFPSRHLLDPKTHQIHYRTENKELTYEAKKYPNTKHISLPPISDFSFLDGDAHQHLTGGKSPTTATRPLDQERLAALLLFSAGLHKQTPDKQQKLQRWSATGGNLGSVELYLIALHVPDLEAGIYFYQSHNHSLAALQTLKDEQQTQQFLQQGFVLNQLPDALIIVASAFHRVSHKYAAFGYRICHLDAGFALGQIQMVGSSIGLQVQIVPSWADEVIAEKIDLAPLEEMVAAVVAISGLQ